MTLKKDKLKAAKEELRRLFKDLEGIRKKNALKEVRAIINGEEDENSKASNKSDKQDRFW